MALIRNNNAGTISCEAFSFAKGRFCVSQIHPIQAQEAYKNNVLALMEIGGEHAWVVSVTH